MSKRIASAGCTRRGRHLQPARRMRGLAALAVAVATLAAPGLQAVPLAHATAQATTPAAPVTIFPSLRSPQPVGTSIRWTAVTSTHSPVYRFDVATNLGGPYQTVRDFSPRSTMLWTRLQEGTYYIRVTDKSGYNGTSTTVAVASFTLSSRVRGAAVVSPSGNPLVALYSAPACSAGQMEVRFRPQGSGAQSWSSTSTEPCVAGQSRNFWVAGMRAQTTYQMVNVIINGSSSVTSTSLAFTTGRPPSSVVFPTVSVAQPPGPQSDLSAPLVFHALLRASSRNGANPVATDLQGNLVWYAVQPDLFNLWALRIEQQNNLSGDAIYLMGNDGQQAANQNVLRVIDLAGNPVQETNVQELNTQLVARGQRIIYALSHDVLQLPNGDTAVFGTTQETITTTSIMGDMLIVLDSNLQVVWTWDAFQHLDPHRGPTLGDTCSQSYPTCPVPGGPNTIDWTHANAIDYTPTDGDLILSLRSQDWIIKINYANGSGDGSVLWRMGPQGDFTIVPLNPADPYPWFSHQHDANYIDSTTLEVYDNGNTRCTVLPAPCHSRGQVYEVNEATRVVTQTVNDDLGTFSAALGVAQRLSNGNYNFASGDVVFPFPPYGEATEVLPDGSTTFVQRVNTLEYRAWRLPTLYSSINPPCPSCPS